MIRRDVFNLLFRGNADTAIKRQPDPVVTAPGYLDFEGTVEVTKKWEEISLDEEIALCIAAAYAFEITVDLNYCPDAAPDRAEIAILIGNNISLGINKEGCLFIGGLADSRQIGPAQLAAGLQMIVSVTPQRGNQPYARLKVVDRTGLTIAILKSAVYSEADWAGQLILPAVPKLCYRWLTITGRNLLS